MRNKVLLVVILVIFVAGIVLANSFLNNENDKDDSNGSNITEDRVVVVNSSNFEKEVLNSDKKVLVDFYADWCGPCQMLSPLVAEVSNEYDDVKFVKIDTDENNDLSARYRIMYLPTLIVIENGNEVARSVGLIEKEKIEELIK